MDLEMWFYLLEQGSMAILADEVCAIRRHPGQITRGNIASGALLDENIVLFEEYGGRPYIRKSLFNMTMRRARLAYRVWLCRDSLTNEKRNAILHAHSSRAFYFGLVPVMAAGLAMWRRLGAAIRSLVRAS